MCRGGFRRVIFPLTREADGASVGVNRVPCGVGMTFRAVSLGLVYVLSSLYAGHAACVRSDAVGPSIKAQPNSQAGDARSGKAGRDLARLLHNAETGDRDAQFEAGQSYENGCGVAQDYSKSAYWYRKAADSGHPGAQSSLGGMYLLGRGVEQSDGEALKWYLRAALEGYAPAQNNVGYMYAMGRAGRNGAGVWNGDDEALKWYRKAAKAGSAAGELNVGLAYFNGNGVQQDLPESVKWFLKAAEHGSAAACDQLGRVYQHGWGTAQDYSAADKWYQAAIERGYALAERDRSGLEEARQTAGGTPAARAAR